MALLLDDEATPRRASSARRSTATRSRSTMSRTPCGRFSPMWTRCSTRPGPSIYLEHRVVFPTIADTFGTCDLLVRIGNTIHVIDFKFGSGVRVLALYPDGDEDVINAQLLFYAAAARHSLPEFFAGVDNIVLTILQPMSIEPDAEMVSSVAVTHAELDEFIAVYRAACEEALSPAPRLERGPIAGSARRDRFARRTPARCSISRSSRCRRLPSAARSPRRPRRTPICRLLADGLNLVDAVKDIGTALHDQAKRALESGDVVPGYALSAGRAVRHWRDERRRDRRADRARSLSATTSSPRRCARRNRSSFAPRRAASRSPTELIVSHPLRRLAGAERERTRPGARTERDRAVVFRGTRSLPRREANHDQDITRSRSRSRSRPRPTINGYDGQSPLRRREARSPP